MACCSLLLYLLVRVRRRAGGPDQLPTSSVVTWTVVGRGASSARTRVMLLVLTTAVEVAAAAALAIWLFPSLFSPSLSVHNPGSAVPQKLSSMSGMTMSGMSMPPPDQFSWGADQNLIAILIAIGALLMITAVLALYLFDRGNPAPWSARRSGAFALGAGALSFGVSGVASNLAMRSETAMMLQFELLTVIGPLLVSVALAPLTWPRFRSAPLALGLSTAAALAWSAMLVVWHLPSLDGSGGWGTARVILAAACGIALWLGVVRPLSPVGISPRGRLARLLFAGEAGALIGLMMLLARGPLFGASGSMHESLLDQRMAGALMMAVDLVFILPVAFWLGGWRAGSERALAT